MKVESFLYRSWFLPPEVWSSSPFTKKSQCSKSTEILTKHHKNQKTPKRFHIYYQHNMLKIVMLFFLKFPVLRYVNIFSITALTMQIWLKNTQNTQFAQYGLGWDKGTHSCCQIMISEFILHSSSVSPWRGYHGDSRKCLCVCVRAGRDREGGS